MPRRIFTRDADGQCAKISRAAVVYVFIDACMLLLYRERVCGKYACANINTVVLPYVWTRSTMEYHVYTMVNIWYAFTISFCDVTIVLY